jgi:hypothetical protein
MFRYTRKSFIQAMIYWRGHPVRNVPAFCQRYKVSPSYDRIIIIIIRFRVMAGGQIRDYSLLTFKRKLKFI